MPQRAVLRIRDTDADEWRNESFESLDEAINMYKSYVHMAARPDGILMRELELHVVAPGMQKAVYAPLPGRPHENGIIGYEPVASVRLARLNLSHGGAVLRKAIDASRQYTEWTRGMFARICAHKSAQPRGAVTWSRAPQSTCAGWTAPRTKYFDSADAALDALSEASAFYDALELRLLHLAIDTDLRDIDEDVADNVVSCIVGSMATKSLYERATPDTLGGSDAGIALYQRVIALPAPPMLA